VVKLRKPLSCDQHQHEVRWPGAGRMSKRPDARLGTMDLTSP